VPDITSAQPLDLIDKLFEFSPLPFAKGRFEVWEPPVANALYVIGGDCAYGIEGRDYDAAFILRKGDGKSRQVAELHGHWGETFDRVLYAAAKFYAGEDEGAFIVLERQVGLPILRRLWNDFGHTHLYFERDQVKAGKPRMDALGHPRVYDDFTLRALRRAVLDQEIVIRSSALLAQMRKLEFYAKGEEPGVGDRARDEKLQIRLPGGGSPDMVMAAAYAWLGNNEVVHFDRPKRKFVPQDHWAQQLDGDGWQEDDQ
jgi:hypothetical protein